MHLGASTVSGPRPYNEDAFLLRDLSGSSSRLGGLVAFIMVSDGMGGHQSGDIASRVAVEAAEAYVDDLIQMASSNQLEVDAGHALQEIVAEAHDAVLRAAAENGASSMGATFIAAFISERRAWIGHVGDSRAYLLHDGEGRQLTVDHSQVGRMIAEGILTEEQAQTHPQRNVIERALGFDGVSADITETELTSGDVVLLCSDGLSTVLTGQDMVQIAGAESSIEKAADALTEQALTAGTDDNTTVAIWSDDWSLFRMSSPAESGRGRRSSQKRRQMARHGRAQRASLWAVVIVVLAAVGIGAVALLSSQPTGGVIEGGATGETSGTVPADIDDVPPAVPTEDEADVWVVAETDRNYDSRNGVWIRSERSTGRSSYLVRLQPGTPLRFPSDGPGDSRDFLRVEIDRSVAVTVTPLYEQLLPQVGWIWASSTTTTNPNPQPGQ